MIDKNNFWQSFTIEGTPIREWHKTKNFEQFINTGPFRVFKSPDPKNRRIEEKRTAYRNINLFTCIIARYPFDWKRILRDTKQRYKLKTDFTLDNKMNENLFQSLGPGYTKSNFEIHHMIQEHKKGMPKCRSVNKDFLDPPSDRFRDTVIARDKDMFLELLTCCLISPSTHKFLTHISYQKLNKEWYLNQGVKLPKYWTSQKHFEEAIREINDVFGTDYNPQEIWISFNYKIS